MKRKNATLLLDRGVLFLAVYRASDSLLVLHILTWGANDQGRCDVPNANDFIAIPTANQHSLARNLMVR